MDDIPEDIRCSRALCKAQLGVKNRLKAKFYRRP